MSSKRLKGGSGREARHSFVFSIPAVVYDGVARYGGWVEGGESVISVVIVRVSIGIRVVVKHSLNLRL